MNGAPTSYAAKQPARNNVQPPQCNRRTVGATLVSPGTPPPGTPPPGTPPPQSTRTPPSTRNPTARFPLPEPERVSRMYPYGDRKNDTPARKNGDCSRQNWQGIHPKMRGNRKTFCLLTFFYPPHSHVSRLLSNFGASTYKEPDISKVNAHSHTTTPPCDAPSGKTHRTKHC